MSLASESYNRLATLTDNRDVLNLAWNLDEREFLDVNLPEFVSGQLRAEIDAGLPYVSSYFVADPFGAAELGPAVAQFFGRPGWSSGVTCGAGVISLLHALSLTATSTAVHVVGDVFPDLAHWVRKIDARRVVPFDQSGGPELAGGLILADRPSPLSTEFDDLDRVRQLCAHAARRGAVVVIDESYANYYPPGYSAAPLTDEVDSLVVLRGLSKGYWLGGLRLGYAVSSAAVTDRLRTMVPPMQASSLSLRIGRAVLELGDITAGLRDRISVAKRETVAALTACGLPAPASAGEFIPHLLFNEPTVPGTSGTPGASGGPGTGGLAGFLAERGVQGKTQPFWSGDRSRVTELFRLSVPLAPERLTEFRRRVAAATVS